MHSFIRINLLPQKKGLKIPKLPIGTIIGVAIIAILSFYLFGPALESEQAKIGSLENKMDNLKKEHKRVIAQKEKELDELNSQVTAYRRRVNMVKSIITGDDVVAWTRILESLTEVTEFQGSGVWLTKFNVQGDNRASLSGVAEKDWGVVSNFIEKLKKNDYFSEVNLSNAVKNFMDDGTQNLAVYHFEITCRINKERM
ncbi:MAG: PilN domain-containing protein [Candidatus Muiribacteriaceae bacterium]